MKKNFVNASAFIFVVVLILLLVPFYKSTQGLDIQAEEKADREKVHNINGKPCAALVFKCCGAEIEGKMASYYDVWESVNIFGRYHTYVYYDHDQKVVFKEETFQWFYNPDEDLNRDPDSCL